MSSGGHTLCAIQRVIQKLLPITDDRHFLTRHSAYDYRVTERNPLPFHRRRPDSAKRSSKVVAVRPEDSSVGGSSNAAGRDEWPADRPRGS